MDRHGDIYVASGGGESSENTKGRIDVFNPQGEYLTEIKDEFVPCSLAVDSVGNVYVSNFRVSSGVGVVLYEPNAYPPTSATEYGSPTAIYTEPAGSSGAFPIGVAIDPSNDHLYVTTNFGFGSPESPSSIKEYDSAANGSTPIRTLIPSFAKDLGGIDVYGANHDIYFSGLPASTPNGEYALPGAQRVFIAGSNGELKREISGASVPGGFGFEYGQAEVAVDQVNGDFYVDDVAAHKLIDEFDAQGNLITQLQHSFTRTEIGRLNAAIAVDDPMQQGEPGYDSPNAGHVYVGVGESPAKAHLYAFSPPAAGPSAPEIEAQIAQEATETEVVLSARLSASGSDTTYRFEYATQADFEANGYDDAASIPIPEADAGSEGTFQPVSEPVSGLQPGTAYRFRLVATNHCDEAQPEVACVTQGEGSPGEAGEDAAFSTFPAEVGLPDGRAYELVTPPDTNGRIPTMAELGSGFNGSGFNTDLATPDGDGVAFGVEGGSLPALGGGGFHDTYEARRTPAGWQSSFTGLSGAQAQRPNAGGIAADHSLAFWEVEGDHGTLALHLPGNYVRRPGGVIDPECSLEPSSLFEFVGCGSLEQEPYANGKWISPGGSHVIFLVSRDTTSNAPGVQLEPCAPPTGTAAIYDRTPDGVTHCVSVKADGSPFAAGEDANYEGASADGSVVAFRVGGELYAHLDDAITIEAASGDTRFAGLSEDGGRLFYLRPNATTPLRLGSNIPQGEMFMCDVRQGPCAGPEQSQQPTQIGAGEESIFVNVSPDGSHVYFVSPVQLLEGEGTPGKDNLYVWDAQTEALSFIAVLDSLDVVGEGPVGETVNGLGLWVTSVVSPNAGRLNYAGAASDPSRSSADGSELLFESRADLGYENAGHTEIYRYQAGPGGGDGLTCVSCNPTGLPATADAQLQSKFGRQFSVFPPVNSATPVDNLTADGEKAFFQSPERLVNGDVDGKLDVYEWEARGVGGCELDRGCIHLISGGHSAGDDYLYAASPSGDDVFFESGDTLVAQDPDRTPSIYDARAPHVPGEAVGFSPPPPPSGECLGEACQPSVSAPQDATPSSASFRGAGNVKAGTCPKGRRRMRVHGRARCVKRHGKSHRAHGRAHHNRRGSK